MDWKEKAICQGKTGFTTYEKATRQVKRKNYRVAKKKNGLLKAYRCPCCRMWHVGSASDMDEMRKYRWDR